MTKTIEQLIQKMHKNGELLSLQKQDGENEVKHNFTSCYVKGKKVFIRGEYLNPSSSSRKALLTLTHGETNEIIGKFHYWWFYQTWLFPNWFSSNFQALQKLPTQVVSGQSNLLGSKSRFTSSARETAAKSTSTKSRNSWKGKDQVWLSLFWDIFFMEFSRIYGNHFWKSSKNVDFPKVWIYQK